MLNVFAGAGGSGSTWESSVSSNDSRGCGNVCGLAQCQRSAPSLTKALTSDLFWTSAAAKQETRLDLAPNLQQPKQDVNLGQVGQFQRYHGTTVERAQEILKNGAFGAADQQKQKLRFTTELGAEKDATKNVLDRKVETATGMGIIIKCLVDAAHVTGVVMPTTKGPLVWHLDNTQAVFPLEWRYSNEPGIWHPSNVSIAPNLAALQQAPTPTSTIDFELGHSVSPGEQSSDSTLSFFEPGLTPMTEDEAMLME